MDTVSNVVAVLMVVVATVAPSARESSSVDRAQERKIRPIEIGRISPSFRPCETLSSTPQSGETSRH